MKGWTELCKRPEPALAPIVREFYAKLCGERDGTIFVPGKWVPFGKKEINEYYQPKEENREEFQALAQRPSYDTILKHLIEGKVSWKKFQ